MIVKLPKEFTIGQLAELRATLITALHKSNKVQLDASETVSVDVAGLQLLCAVHRAAVAQKKALLPLDGTPTEVIRAAMDMAGFGIHNDCFACKRWKGTTNG
jgi:ABC-type transporter Mla MlaB component